MNRRALFKAIAATAAAVALAPLGGDDYWHTAGLIPTVFPPRLWGDGVHDDWPAIQAMANDAVARNVPFILANGRHFLSRPITLPRNYRPGAMIVGCWLKVPNGISTSG